MPLLKVPVRIKLANRLANLDEIDDATDAGGIGIPQILDILRLISKLLRILVHQHADDEHRIRKLEQAVLQHHRKP